MLEPVWMMLLAVTAAAAALWLCDANSAAINGQAIAIAGGEVM